MSPDAVTPTTSLTNLVEDLRLLRAFSDWGPEPTRQLKEHIAHVESTGFLSSTAFAWMMTVDPAAGLNAPVSEQDAQRRLRVIARLGALAMRVGGFVSPAVEKTSQHTARHSPINSLSDVSHRVSKEGVAEGFESPARGGVATGETVSGEVVQETNALSEDLAHTRGAEIPDFLRLPVQKEGRPRIIR